MRYEAESPESENLRDKVRNYAVRLAKRHNPWLLENHLYPAEKIALQLCYTFPSAQKDVVLNALWFHDIKKISGDQPGEKMYLFLKSMCDQGLLPKMGVQMINQMAKGFEPHEEYGARKAESFLTAHVKYP